MAPSHPSLLRFCFLCQPVPFRSLFIISQYNILNLPLFKPFIPIRFCILTHTEHGIGLNGDRGVSEVKAIIVSRCWWVWFWVGGGGRGLGRSTGVKVVMGG